MAFQGASATVLGVLPADFQLYFPKEANVPANVQAYVPFREHLPCAADALLYSRGGANEAGIHRGTRRSRIWTSSPTRFAAPSPSSPRRNCSSTPYRCTAMRSAKFDRP